MGYTRVVLPPLLALVFAFALVFVAVPVWPSEGEGWRGCGFFQCRGWWWWWDWRG